jgi:putative molybdopterin biosynthesis protein
MHLKQLAIDPDRVIGYEKEEYTHMNVASAIVSNNADTGLAIRAAAVALDLDFIPLAQERYDIILPKEHSDDSKVRAFLQTIMESKNFRQTVEGLGGYDLRDCGTVMYEQ